MQNKKMLWQDISIMISNIILGFSSIMLVYKGFKLKRGVPSLVSAILFPIALYGLAVSYFSFNLYLAAAIVTINGTSWIILLLQKLKYG